MHTHKDSRVFQQSEGNCGELVIDLFNLILSGVALFQNNIFAHTEINDMTAFPL